ncbi:MAG: hypothetical protein IPI69_09110 [Bacteroidales bacterium]|jgi:hypothetical protein|nr:hypothetical protein [Bacteroidales bacterium]MBP7037403.1 hypothetical protein [Bacteroidales bacterium]MDI9553389.1 hypothetical protein [Bacteroidota bacterium]NLK54398.1 hypothetical protein [Bacteroidales bacterium]
MNSERIITVILIIALSISLSAQNSKKQTVVLKGGSHLTGTILFAGPDSLKMRITSPQVITLNKSDITLSSPVQGIEKPFIDRHGYSIRLSASSLTGRNDEEKTGSMSFHFSNAYTFKNGLSIGFGTGYEEFDVTVMPVYADLRYHPLKTRMSPFAWIKSGWSFGFSKLDDGRYYYYNFPESKGGLMFNTGAGMELASWRRNAVNIGVGYRYQKITYKYEHDRSERYMNELITCYNRLEVQFGFVFR